MTITKKAGLFLAAAAATTTLSVAAVPQASATGCTEPAPFCHQEVGGPYYNLEKCKNEHWTRYVRAQNLWPNRPISASGCFARQSGGYNWVITVYR